MKIKNILCIILMTIFIVFTYLFLERGMNTKTKVDVPYQEKGDIIYQVYLHQNDLYDKEYLNMNERYITELVDDIPVDFSYKSLFNKNLNGYYSYRVINTLVGYTDNINESLFKKEETLLDKTVPLNQNNLKEINITDKFVIDYDKYLAELKKYNQDYNVKISGYLEVKIIIDENLDFFGNDNVIEDTKEMKMIIPLSYDTFKITIQNDYNNVNKYSGFSKREKINYIFLILGALCLSAGTFFLVQTIKIMINESYDEINYRKELKKIIDEHGDILVKVNKFYSEHKYNLIYVTSFPELMDAYRRVENPISYKEVKKNAETIFLMIDDDSAWIYRLSKNK